MFRRRRFAVISGKLAMQSGDPTMTTRPHYLLALATALILAAMPAMGGEKKPKVLPKPGTVDAAGTYQMSADELALDCKRLTGKMQIRILQFRDYDPARKPSAVGNALHTLHNPFIGGTTRGMDPAAEHQADIAMLHTYNKRLAEKKCRTFDLEAELKPQAAGALLPRPQAPAAKK